MTDQKCQNYRIQDILPFNNVFYAYKYFYWTYYETFLFVTPASAGECIHNPGVYHGEARTVGCNTAFIIFFTQYRLRPIENK